MEISSAPVAFSGASAWCRAGQELLDAVGIGAGLQSMAKALSWGGALDLVLRMALMSLESNVLIATELLGAQSDLKGAWQRGLLKLAKADASYYHMVMSCCGARWRQVLLLIRKLPEMRVVPEPRSFGILLKALPKWSWRRSIDARQLFLAWI